MGEASEESVVNFFFLAFLRVHICSQLLCTFFPARIPWARNFAKWIQGTCILQTTGELAANSSLDVFGWWGWSLGTNSCRRSVAPTAKQLINVMMSSFFLPTCILGLSYPSLQPLETSAHCSDDPDYTTGVWMYRQPTNSTRQFNAAWAMSCPVTELRRTDGFGRIPAFSCSSYPCFLQAWNQWAIPFIQLPGWFTPLPRHGTAKQKPAVRNRCLELLFLVLQQVPESTPHITPVSRFRCLWLSRSLAAAPSPAIRHLASVLACTQACLFPPSMPRFARLFFFRRMFFIRPSQSVEKETQSTTKHACSDG